MADANVSFKPRSFGQTMRPDAWWAQPALVFLGLGAFVVYSTWAAFQGAHYYSGAYVSPFYSPEIFVSSATIIGARTTNRFGPTRPRAVLASRAKHIAAKTPSRSSCRTYIATSC